MKWLYNLLFVNALLLLSAHLPHAQDSCYLALRAEGIRYLEQENYRMSINRFIAAQFCMKVPPDNDLVQLVARAQEEWVEDLENAREQADQAAREALAAKEFAEAAQKKAENASREEQEARRIAEAYAREAEEQAVLTEANRLALLAENEIKSHNYSDALYLAFRAMQLSEEQAQPQIELTFGRAVYAYFTRTLSGQKGKAAFFLPFKTKPELTALSEGNNVYRFSLSTPQNLRSSAFPLVKNFGNLAVIDMIISPDERFLLVCAENGSATLLDLLKEKDFQLKGHREDVLGGAFSPVEGKLLTWSMDNTAVLWDTNGELLATFTGHNGDVQEGCFSPDGAYILTRSSDRSVRLWDHSGRPLNEPLRHTGYIYSATFSPDSHHILTASADSTARLWKLDGQLAATLGPHGDAVKEALFGPTGKQILTRSLDGNLRIWSVEGQLLAQMPCQNGYPLGAYFNREGSQVIGFTSSGEVTIWNVDGSQALNLDAQTGAAISAFWGPDEQLILSSSTDGTAKLWNRDGHLLMSVDVQQPQRAPARFSADGRSIIAISRQGELIQCPVPQVCFREMAANLPFTKEEVRRLNQKNKIAEHLRKKFKEQEPEDETKALQE